MTTSRTVVFLDANILAKPVTRTFLMAGGMPSGFHAVWSETSETEAVRHMRPRATSPAVIRRRLGADLSPTGDVAGRFLATRAADRQILADTVAAGARFLITEDVDDYAPDDLAQTGVAAVNPDLFLAERLARAAYALVIELFAERQNTPRRTQAELHAAVARQHPRLFAAHADLIPDTRPGTAGQAAPAVVFRGRRCLRCEDLVDAPTDVVGGVCAACRPARSCAPSPFPRVI